MKRVLITGISRMWGAALAARLESDSGIEEIVAIDRDDPVRQLARTEYVRADIRHSLVGKLVRALGIDTVVHAGTIVDTRNASPRRVHETNVIGTMNLLAACSGADSPVRTLVVKSSTALYGAAADAPSFWSESMRRPRPADRFGRDLEEMEAYVSDFAARQPQTKVTVMRFADVLGAADDTPFGAYLSLPVVPTVLGFDPRLQFVHEEDVVDALHHAVHHPHGGIVNVAADGVVILSQAISMMGRVNAPVLPFAGASLVTPLLRRARLLPLPDHLVPVIQHGRVVDTTRLRTAFGFTPRHSSVDCVRLHAEWKRTDGLVEEPYTFESDLETFLRGKAQDHASAGAGARTGETPVAAGRQAAAAPKAPVEPKATGAPKASAETVKRTATRKASAERVNHTATWKAPSAGAARRKRSAVRPPAAGTGPAHE